MNINPELRGKLIRIGIFFLAYSLLFIALSHMLGFVLPFAIAFLLSVLIRPIVRTLTVRFKWGGALTAALMTLLICAFLFALIFMLAYILISETVALTVSVSKIDFAVVIPYFQEISEYLNSMFTGLGDDFSAFIKNNMNDIINVLRNSIGFVTNALNFVVKFVLSIPTWITAIIVTIFATFFFTKDILPQMRANSKKYLTQGVADKISDIWRNTLSMIGKCARSYMILYFITFAESLIIFSILDINYPLVFALLAGIADLFPILGPGAVYLPLAVFYALRPAHNYLTAILIAAAWLLISVVRQILEPKLVGSTINVHPLIMLAILYAGLQSGSIVLMIYLVGLVILYKIFSVTGVFDFEAKQPKQDPPQASVSDD